MENYFNPDLPIRSFCTGNLYNYEYLWKAGHSTRYKKELYSGLREAHMMTELQDGQQIVKVTKEHSVCNWDQQGVFTRR